MNEKIKYEKNPIKAILIVVGIILIIFGVLLLISSSDDNFGGDPSIRARKAEPYKIWGTICMFSGVATLLVGIIYKGNDKNNSNNITENPVNVQNIDFANKLEELKGLLDKEIITQEEYENKKQEILNKL